MRRAPSQTASERPREVSSPSIRVYRYEAVSKNNSEHTFSQQLCSCNFTYTFFDLQAPWVPEAWVRCIARDTRLRREVAVKVLPESSRPTRTVFFDSSRRNALWAR